MAPTCSSESVPAFFLYILGPPALLPRAGVVEDDERMIRGPQIRDKDFRRSMETARVAAWMDLDLVLETADLKRFCSVEERVESLAFVVSRNQDDEVELWRRAHPKIPVANSVPRSLSRFQSRSRGCKSPLTMSVAPSAVRAKQRMSLGSARESRMGEWLAQSI